MKFLKLISLGLLFLVIITEVSTLTINFDINIEGGNKKGGGDGYGGYSSSGYPSGGYSSSGYEYKKPYYKPHYKPYHQPSYSKYPPKKSVPYHKPSYNGGYNDYPLSISTSGYGSYGPRNYYKREYVPKYGAGYTKSVPYY